MNLQQILSSITSSNDTLDIPLPSGQYICEVTHCEQKFLTREIDTSPRDDGKTRKTRDGFGTIQASWIENTELAKMSVMDDSGNDLGIPYIYVRMVPKKAFPNVDAELDEVPNWKEKALQANFFAEAVRVELLGKIFPAAEIDIDDFINAKKKAGEWTEYGLAEHMNELFSSLIGRSLIVQVVRDDSRNYMNVKAFSPVH